MAAKTIVHYARRPIVGTSLIAVFLLAITLFTAHERYMQLRHTKSQECLIEADKKVEDFQNTLREVTAATSTLNLLAAKYGIGADFDSVLKLVLRQNERLDAVGVQDVGSSLRVSAADNYTIPSIGKILKSATGNASTAKAGHFNIAFTKLKAESNDSDEVIAYKSIFRSDSLYGYSVVLFNPSKLIATDEQSAFLFQISIFDTASGAEYFLLHPPKTFDTAHAAFATIVPAMHQTGWRIYVMPAQPILISVLPLIVAAILLSLFGGFVAWNILGRPKRLKRQVDEAVNRLGIAEGKYQALFQQASDAILIHNDNYEIVDSNDRAEAVLGYSKAELMQMTVFDLFDQEYIRQKPLQMTEIQSGDHLLTERAMIKKDGTPIFVETNVKKIGPDRIMAILRDVTEHRRAQRQIAVNEALLRNSIDNSANGIAIASLDGFITRANPALCTMVGYAPEELRGLRFHDISHPDDLAKELDIFGKCVMGLQDSYSIEKRLFRKDGTTVWVSVNVSAIKGEAESPTHFFTQVEDITEKIAMRELLKRRENQLEAFVENNPAAVAMFDEDMRYLVASHKWIAYNKLDEKEYVGKGHYELFPHLSLRWKEAHNRSLAGIIEKCDEDSYLTRSGKTRWIKWEIHPWRTESGRVGGTILLSEDITDRHEADNNYRLLIEQSLVGVYIFQDGKFMYVNPRMAETYGYTQQELMTMENGTDIIQEDDRAIAHEQINLRETGQKQEVHYEIRGVKKDGTVIWTEIFGAATLYKGRPAVIGTLQDITERKSAESLIMYEKNLSDTIIDGLPGLFYIAERDGKLVRWNHHLETLTGRTSRELQGKYTLDFVDPGQEPQILKRRAAAFETGKATDEIRIISGNGEILTYFICIMPIIYNGVQRILGIGLDFTDRKRAEAELIAKTAEAETRTSELKAFFENIEGAASLLDTQKRYVIFNRQFMNDHRRLTNLDPVAGMEVYDHFPQEIKAERLKFIDKVIHEEKKAVVEADYVRDGKHIYYRTSFTPVISDGKVTGISTYSMDLTMIRESEHKLRRTNHELAERVKELRCLYSVSKFANDDGSSVTAIMKGLVDLVLPGWQFPEIAASRVIYADKVYSSEHFRESKWVQEAPIVSNGSVIGRIEVCYIEEKPEEAEGPFLKEERSLINSIADMVGSAIEKRISRDEILKLNRLYQFTSAINEMMLRNTDEATIYKEACEIAVKQGGYRLAWIGSVEPTDEHVDPIAIAGHDNGYLVHVKTPVSKRERSLGPAATAIRTRTHQYCNDIATDPRMVPWRTEALKRGYRALVSLPVIVDTQFIALFTLYRSEPYSINDTEIKLLKDVTDNIAYAVDNLRIKEAKQQYIEKLSESEQLFRKLTEETYVGVYILQNHRFVYVNPRFEEITGYRKDMLLHDFAFEKLVHKDDVDKVWKAYLSRMNGEQPAGQYTFKGVRADNAVRHIELITSLIRYNGKLAIMGSVIDITEKVEEEKRFNLAVTEAQENERIAIGMELHDNVKQMMATSLLSLYGAKTSLDDKDTAALFLDGAQQQIKESVAELRRISHQLAPSIDTSLPFEEKITALVSSMNVSDTTKIDFEFRYPEKLMTSNIQLAMYRIVQEQVANIQKYAMASSVRISVTQDEGDLVLVVADDGVGFDSTDQKKGIGLENIKRRAKALNGSMQVESAPGSGCTLTVVVPFE